MKPLLSTVSPDQHSTIVRHPHFVFLKFTWRDWFANFFGSTAEVSVRVTFQRRGLRSKSLSRERSFSQTWPKKKWQSSSLVARSG